MFRLKPDKLYPKYQSESRKILKTKKGYWTIKEYWGMSHYLSFDFW